MDLFLRRVRFLRKACFFPVSWYNLAHESRTLIGVCCDRVASRIRCVLVRSSKVLRLQRDFASARTRYARIRGPFTRDVPARRTRSSVENGDVQHAIPKLVSMARGRGVLHRQREDPCRVYVRRTHQRGDLRDFTRVGPYCHRRMGSHGCVLGELCVFARRSGSVRVVSSRGLRTNARDHMRDGDSSPTRTRGFVKKI